MSRAVRSPLSDAFITWSRGRASANCSRMQSGLAAAAVVVPWSQPNDARCTDVDKILEKGCPSEFGESVCFSLEDESLRVQTAPRRVTHLEPNDFFLGRTADGGLLIFLVRDFSSRRNHGRSTKRWSSLTF